MENVCAQHSSKDIPIKAPASSVAFKMPVFGTWGFSPKPKFWRKFQQFYLDMSKSSTDYKPYIEGMRATNWFKNFEKKSKEETMAHEMWLIHYVAGHKEKLYCLYSNLLQYTGQEKVLLSNHRQEDGLHYSKVARDVSDSKSKLLTHWLVDYGDFSGLVPSYDVNGNLVQNW